MSWGTGGVWRVCGAGQPGLSSSKTTRGCVTQGRPRHLSEPGFSQFEVQMIITCAPGGGGLMRMCGHSPVPRPVLRSQSPHQVSPPLRRSLPLSLGAVTVTPYLTENFGFFGASRGLPSSLSSSQQAPRWAIASPFLQMQKQRPEEPEQPGGAPRSPAARGFLSPGWALAGPSPGAGPAGPMRGSRRRPQASRNRLPGLQWPWRPWEPSAVRIVRRQRPPVAWAQQQGDASASPGLGSGVPAAGSSKGPLSQGSWRLRSRQERTSRVRRGDWGCPLLRRCGKLRAGSASPCSLPASGLPDPPGRVGGAREEERQ